jgi:hypothetical protein
VSTIILMTCLWMRRKFLRDDVESLAGPGLMRPGRRAVRLVFALGPPHVPMALGGSCASVRSDQRTLSRFSRFAPEQRLRDPLPPSVILYHNLSHNMLARRHVAHDDRRAVRVVVPSDSGRLLSPPFVLSQRLKK